MAGLSGKDGSVTVNNTEYEIVDWSLDVSTDMIDTSMSKSNWKDAADGLSGATGSLTVHCDPAKHGPLVRAALPPLTKADIEFLMDGTNGFSGEGFLSGMSAKTEAQGGVDLTFNVQMTGTVSPVGFGA